MHTAQDGARPRLPAWDVGGRGELLLQVEAEVKVEVEAEGCFCQAVETARRQAARSLELRAGLSLSRLWREQGKHEAAQRLLVCLGGCWVLLVTQPNLAVASP
jgi:hypothetical protein